VSIKPDRDVSSRDEFATRRHVHVRRFEAGSVTDADDVVAEEMPVALVYNSVPYVVMLATPADLTDLGAGFTLSEAIVASADAIRAVELTDESGALAVQVSIGSQDFSALLKRRRNLTGRTGCGVCGAETIEEAIRYPAPLGAGIRLTSQELHAELNKLYARQPLNLATGAMHAAAWVLPGKGIQIVREDVGRHNALDKVIGAAVRCNVDLSAGYFIITSRASYEMVQKAATVGVSLVAAVSAPTAFAIDLAERSGLTLVGFARADRHVVYAHSHRLLD